MSWLLAVNFKFAYFQILVICFVLLPYLFILFVRCPLPLSLALLFTSLTHSAIVYALLANTLTLALTLSLTHIYLIKSIFFELLYSGSDVDVRDDATTASGTWTHQIEQQIASHHLPSSIAVVWVFFVLFIFYRTLHFASHLNSLNSHCEFN